MGGPVDTGYTIRLSISRPSIDLLGQQSATLMHVADIPLRALLCRCHSAHCVETIVTIFSDV